jgi:hypothetical protein
MDMSPGTILLVVVTALGVLAVAGLWLWERP